jgi:hypothetical protein
MIPSLSRRTRLIVAALVCVALLGGVIFFLRGGASSTDRIARQMVAACAKSGTDHSTCYESEVPNLYPKLSVAQIFDVVREIRALDPSYQFCHVLAHKIGNRAVAEDPNNWVDVIPLNPADSLCSNGFIHGVFEGRFGADVLSDATIQQFMPQFVEACEPHDGWNPSNLDRAICYHGMGHLADYITNADLPKALNFCSQVAPSDYQRVCIQGVFMQIYQPLEPDDYALIAQMPVKPTKDTVRQFCATFHDPEYVGSCLEESWPMFQNSILDGTGVASFCSGQPDATETNQCYVSMSSIIGRTSLGNSEKAVSACNQFPAAQQETCYSYSAQAVLEEDLSQSENAIALCERAPAYIAEQCMSDLIQHAQFTFGNNTQAHKAFCAAVPQSLQASCSETE